MSAPNNQTLIEKIENTSTHAIACAYDDGWNAGYKAGKEQGRLSAEIERLELLRAELLITLKKGEQ